MTPSELEAVAAATADAVKIAVDAATAPLLARLKALEDRAPEPGPAGQDGAPGAPGERGHDGRDGRDGKDGKDGRDGQDGKDGAPGAAGEKGQDGRPGADGFSLEDFQVAYDGERTLTLSFVRGELMKSNILTLPVLLYRGVFQEGQTYAAGDVVTWGGSSWVAKAETTAKPGLASEASRAWQLAIKAGRDGRQGPAGPTGPPGPRGDKGDPGRHAS